MIRNETRKKYVLVRNTATLDKMVLTLFIQNGWCKERLNAGDFLLVDDST